MYLEELFDITIAIPSINAKNATILDNFLGDIGTGNIFEKASLTYRLTQKSLVNPIINWLQEAKVIVPYKQTCPVCKQEYNFPKNKCDICDSDLLLLDTVTTYKITKPLIESEKVKNANTLTINPLDMAAFNLLKKSLDKKIREKKNGYILFIDVANSTKLAKENKNFQVSINKGLSKYLKESVKNYFRRSKAIYIKGAGDSSYLYFDNINILAEYLKQVLINLESQDFSEKTRIMNDEGKLCVFYKIYIADSDILEYKTTDVLSIDFEAMEAFTFIGRIEKGAEQKVKDIKGEENLYPCFIVMKENYFRNGTKIQLTNIKNYGEVDVWFLTSNEFLTIV